MFAVYHGDNHNNEMQSLTGPFFVSTAVIVFPSPFQLTCQFRFVCISHVLSSAINFKSVTLDER